MFCGGGLFCWPGTKSYLEWLTQLPWGHASVDNFDLKKAKHVLDEVMSNPLMVREPHAKKGSSLTLVTNFLTPDKHEHRKKQHVREK